MFRGDHDSLEIASTQRSWLWPQLIGITSAVAYLHETSNTAHRDIKPSNVLVYVDAKNEGPTLKLADFGLSVDLSDAITWQKGSTAAKSALPYDAPEYRSAYMGRLETVPQLPSPSILLSNDIWKLGCVFTELAAFIVGGSKGVKEFRHSILTETRIDKTKFVSDSLENVDNGKRMQFDNGERVKPEVIQAIETLSTSCEEVAQIRYMLNAMLGEADVRPKAREICQYLIQFYIIKTGQDQVHLGDVELPPPAQANSNIPEYEHGINPPDAIQMKLVGAQIVAGLRDPGAVRGQTEMVSMLPKKRVPPDFKKTMRAMGWGMHAKMGYSAKKILWWLMFCVVFLVVSAAPWLIWVDHFDLQNAFMPGCTILAVLTICVAVAQTDASHNADIASPPASLRRSNIPDIDNSDGVSSMHRKSRTTVNASRSSSLSSVPSTRMEDDAMAHLDFVTKQKVSLDLETYPPLDHATQDAIVAAYRRLDDRLRAQGLYDCNYRAHATEVSRYTMLFAVMLRFFHWGW
ncbi:fatty acid desaturase [Colletotrichum gloeosporioides Cg-14]|uniref:Fatty acid desaturase n=1 Tax=Colletotrichum gloeosporioides (strain Cg-14) TaxID=1237896 RepID=T0K2A5_COLGC|nr:fatty acid desaturase [Colletotrichum gloeosporioides Cg-14]